MALLAAWGAWVVQEILNPLVAAYVLAYIAHPLVLRLEGRGWSRQRSVNTIYAVLAVLTAGTLVAVWTQGSHLAARVLDPEAGLLATLDLRLGEFLEGHRESWWLSWLGPLEGGGDEGSALLLMAQQLWTEFGAGRETAAQARGLGTSSAPPRIALADRPDTDLRLVPAVRVEQIHRPSGGTCLLHRSVARIAQSIGTVLNAFFRGRLTVCAPRACCSRWGSSCGRLRGLPGDDQRFPRSRCSWGRSLTVQFAPLEPGADLGLTFLFVSAVFGWSRWSRATS